MAFQGFARQEDFSTNQIRIDIGSVIDSDLAEAKRISKWHGRNAEFGEKWRGMYLDAMINKHEAEKRNREDNWNFFMENRATIQKQVEYNNSVKAKDAERSHPYIPSLGDILGPALMKMAVDVGGVAIKKHFTDQAENKAVAEAKEKNNVRSAAERLYGSASKEQLELHKSGYWKEYADANAARKIEMRTHWNSLGKHQVGEISAAYQHKISGMDAVDRLNSRFSKDNLANQYGEAIRTGVVHMNGRDVTADDILADPHNDKTVYTFLETIEARFYEESGLLNEGNPYNKGVFNKVKKQIHGKFLGGVHNSNVKQAKIDNTSTNYSKIQLAKESGGIPDVIDIAFNPNNIQSIAAEYGMPYAVDFIKRAIGSGAFTTEELNELYNTSFGPGIPTINEDIRKNTDRGRQYAALRAVQVANEQQQHTNEQAERHVKIDDFIAKTEVSIAPDEARYLLTAINNPNSDFGKSMAKWKPDQVTKFTRVLAERSGVLPETKVYDDAQELQKAVFSESWVNETVTTTAIDILNETKQQTNNFKQADRNKAKGAVRRWLRQLVVARGLDDPAELLGYVDSIVGKDGDTDYDNLKKMLAIKTQDEKGSPIKPVWTYLERSGAEYEFMPEVTGVQQYEAMVARANGPVSNLKEVYQNPQIKAAMKRLHMRLQSAQDANFTPQQIQHILSNHGTPFITARQRQGGGKLSVGMIVNESRKHGGYDDMDLQPLDDSLFLNRQEIEKVEQMIPKFSQMSSPLAARLGQQLTSGQGFPPNVGRSNNLASTFGQGVVETYGPPEINGNWVASSDHGGDNAHLDIKFETPEQNQWMYDYLAANGIVTTEVKGRGAGVTVTHSTTGPYTHAGGHGMDIPMDGRNGLKPGPIGSTEDRAFLQRVQNLIRKGSAIYHSQQRQIKSKQVIDDIPIQPSGNINIEDVQAIDPLFTSNTPTQQAQIVNNNEIMQEWLRKVKGMERLGSNSRGYGND